MHAHMMQKKKLFESGPLKTSIEACNFKTSLLITIFHPTFVSNVSYFTVEAESFTVNVWNVTKKEEIEWCAETA